MQNSIELEGGVGAHESRMGSHDYPNADGDEEVPGDGSEETNS
jgi:hypothetical protein